MKRSLILGIGISAGAAFILPLIGHAAESVYFDPSAVKTGTGDTVAVTVLARSDQPVNAYAISVDYPSELLELEGTDDAGSLLTVRPGGPVHNGAEVRMTGGSLAPFQGTGGKIITIIFRAIASGTGSITVNDAAFYLANGKGTKLLPQKASLSVRVSAASSGPSLDILNETVVPHISSLAIVKDPFEPGRSLLSFGAIDDGSGVKEVDVRYREGFFWSAWQVAANPAPLPHWAWAASIRVVDNAGNRAEATAYDPFALAYTLFTALFGALAVLGIGFAIIKP